MRMWTRVYREAMLVCALALMLAGALLTVANQRESYGRELSRAVAEHAMVRHSMENTISILTRSEGSAEQAARLSFDYASLPGATLALLDAEGNMLESTMEPGLATSFYRGNQVASLLRNIGDSRVLMVEGRLNAGGSQYTLLYARPLDELYAQGRRWGLLMGLGCLAALTLLAVSLRLAVQRSLRPLGQVSQTAERVAGGEYDYVTPDCGIQEIDRLSGSIHRMARSVSSHIQQLNQRNQAQRQLVADLAHEMKTPMSAIIGYAKLLRGASIPEFEQQTALDYIASEGERLERLSLRLMDLAKLQEGAALQLEMVDVSELIDSALSSLAASIEHSGHRIVTNVRVSEIHCDQELMRCLLVNLIDNALKYAPEHTDIEVRCRYVHAGVAMMVSDPGCGVPPDQSELLKQPFFTLDKARTREKHGAGLGLSLCERIAEAHGGRLIVRSGKSGFTAGVILQVENNSKTVPKNASGILLSEPDQRATKRRKTR